MSSAELPDKIDDTRLSVVSDLTYKELLFVHGRMYFSRSAIPTLALLPIAMLLMALDSHTVIGIVLSICFLPAYFGSKALGVWQSYQLNRDIMSQTAITVRSENLILENVRGVFMYRWDAVSNISRQKETILFHLDRSPPTLILVSNRCFTTEADADYFYDCAVKRWKDGLERTHQVTVVPDAQIQGDADG